jgi:hypothetical protein
MTLVTTATMVAVYSLTQPALAELLSAAETMLAATGNDAALADVGLNTALGWCWAAPLAVPVIAALAVKEGLEAWHRKD